MKSPHRLLMLDSGAYTVWSQGASINVDDYIEFCKNHPLCSYYVNLDIIPGMPGEARQASPADVEKAAQGGWDNYQKMLKHLPIEKVIPVFHYDDNIKWLHKYMKFGTPYLGLSPGTKRAPAVKLKWLQSLRKFLFKGDKPLVKTHGFAVTSYDLMKLWQWHSVDSTSWKAFATWGACYLPIERKGEFDYSVPPLVIFTTPQSKKRKRQQHYETMSPMMRDRMKHWLDSCKVHIGESEFIQKDSEYKLNVDIGEIWFDKKKRVMMRPIIKGVSNSFEERAKVCAKLVARSNRVLPIDHIYFAGQILPYPLEFQLKRRLLSYHYSNNPGALRYINEHLKRIKEGR